MKNILVAMLALALIAVGSSKLFGNLPDKALITESLASGIGMLEVTAGLVLGLVPRWRCYTCYGVICLCLVGIAVKVAYPDRLCGCMGSLRGRDYFLALGGLGVLSSGWLVMSGGDKCPGNPRRQRRARAVPAPSAPR